MIPAVLCLSSLALVGASAVRASPQGTYWEEENVLQRDLNAVAFEDGMIGSGDLAGAVRDVPDTCLQTSELVSVTVQVWVTNPVPSALIVKEKLPAGWTVTNALWNGSPMTPSYASGEYKWLFGVGTPVGSGTLTYESRVEGQAGDIFVITGSLLYGTNAVATLGEGELHVCPATALVENVSTPWTPVGSSTGAVNQTLAFTTGGSTNSAGHAVEYRFGWGDGAVSEWGAGATSHAWTSAGFYSVTAQARCVLGHATSAWSSAITVTITNAPMAPPAKVTGPVPASLASGVATTVHLAWSASAGATGYRVHMGTNAVPPYVGSQAGTSYNPGVLGQSRTYYWRIDATNVDHVTTGDVWQFTTAAFSPTRIIGLSGNLAFGGVLTGQVAQLTMVISNSGNSALTVSNIVYPNGFSGAWSGLVGPSQASNLLVSFSPGAIGSFGGAITVQSDAGSGGNSIACSGTGVGAPVTPNQYFAESQPFIGYAKNDWSFMTAWNLNSGAFQVGPDWYNGNSTFTYTLTYQQWIALFLYDDGTAQTRELRWAFRQPHVQ